MSDANETINSVAAINNSAPGAGSGAARFGPASNLKSRSKPVATGDARATQWLAFAGVFLFTLLLYIRPNEMFPDLFGTFPLVKIVAVAAVLAYLGAKLGSGEPVSIFPRELKMVAVITALGVLFAPFAANPQDSLDVLFDMFLKVVIIFALMINVIDTRRRLRLMVSLVVICATILAVFALNSYLTGDFIIVEKKDVGVVGLRILGVVGGIFGNPNDLATSFDLLLPLAVALGLTSSGVKRAVYFGCAGLLMAGVVVTFSRGGFLGLVAMGGVLLWKISHQNRALMALAFAVLFGVFVLALPSGYTGRISSIFHFGEDRTGSTEARRDLLERAASVAAHHPIIGVGMGNFHTYSLHEQVAHNSYLEIAAELGLLGLTAYLVLLFAPLRSLRKIERETRAQKTLSRRAPPGPNHNRAIHTFSVALQASLIAFIVCSFFGSIQYHWFLYYPVAFAVALRRIYTAEQEARATVNNQAAVVAAAEPLPERGVLWRRYRQRVPPLVSDANG
jgi:O-antigen ligase